MTTTVSSILTGSIFGSLAASAMQSVSRRGTGESGSPVRADPARWAMNQATAVDSHVLNVQRRALSDDLSRHQTAETALSNVKEDLARLQEIAEELHAGTDLTETEIGALETEFADRADQIDALVANTSYAEQALVDGSDGSLVDATAATGLALANFDTYLEARDGVQGARDAMVTPDLTIQAGMVPLQHQSSALNSHIEVLDGSGLQTATAAQAIGLADDVRNEILALVADMLALVSNANDDTGRMANLLGESNA